MAKTGEREAVLEILEKVRENGTYSHIAVKEVLDRCEREGMDRQQIVNLVSEREDTDRYPGLMVGSIDNANNNAGNWE